MIGYDTAKPYIASYIIVRKNDRIAFLLRTNTAWMNNFYGLPSGKVEKAESFTSAAIREGNEEIGVKVSPENLRFVHAMHRYTQSESSEWVDIFFEATQYDGEPYNAEPEVHGELAWFDPADLPDNVVPNVKFALEQIKAGHTYSEFGWEN